jgi:hypothetical protein
VSSPIRADAKDLMPRTGEYLFVEGIAGSGLRGTAHREVRRSQAIPRPRRRGEYLHIRLADLRPHVDFDALLDDESYDVFGPSISNCRDTNWAQWAWWRPVAAPSRSYALTSTTVVRRSVMPSSVCLPPMRPQPVLLPPAPPKGMLMSQ